MNVAACVESDMFRQLLVDALGEIGHKVVASCSDLESLDPPEETNLILFQFSVPPMSLIGLRRVAERMSVPVMVMCDSGLHPFVRAELRQSLAGLLDDHQSFELLASAITVIGHGYVLRREGADNSLHSALAGLEGKAAGEVGLTKRETLILTKLSCGYSNKEIARDLKISDSTVKVHLRSIYQKTNLRNRTEAAIWAREHF